MMLPVRDSEAAVADLLPHTGAARLLTRVLRNDSEMIEATGLIQATHPLVSAGRAPCFLGLEIGAQAAAAQEALNRAGATGRPASQIGQVARIREADFFRADLPTDTPIQVSARLQGAAPPLAIYRVSVRVEGVEHLRAVISTHAGPQ